MQPIELQRELAQAGFYRGEFDGIVGRRTIAAVKQFQQAHGLDPDGVVGPLTLQFLPPIHEVSGLVDEMSSNCVDLIKAFEGLGDGDPTTVSLEFYWDVAGYATVGWGHLLLDADRQSIQRKSKSDAYAAVRAQSAMLRWFGKSAITAEEAMALLATDLNACLGQVAPLLEDVTTDPGQLDALVSFAFNVGVGALSSSTVLAYHKRAVPVGKAMDFAALETESKNGVITYDMASAFGAWSKAGGEWSLGLFRRRMAEALVYEGAHAVEAFAMVQAIR